MKKAIVWGATKSAISDYAEIAKKYEIIALFDNDEKKWGEYIYDIEVMPPAKLFSIEWDVVVIISFSAMDAIKEQLLDMGVPEMAIDTSYVIIPVRARENFVVGFAQIVNSLHLDGCVAEAGVFQGNFAKVINENFPDRKLYLFDTFEGFDKRDIEYERKHSFSDAEEGNLNITSEKLVLKKMKYPQQCEIRKGYFPETAEGIADAFCFVNLDMDLYKPTLEGLKFFWDRMVEGGIILVHDFFTNGYEGVNQAVEEFICGRNIVPFSIGDSVSIAIQK